MMIRMMKNIYQWLHNHLHWVVALLFIVVAYVIRQSHFDYVSGDYFYFLQVWMEEIVELGGFASLAVGIGDYSVPYVFILTIISYLTEEWLIAIKLVSIFFDYILAAAVAFIVYFSASKDKGAITQSILAGLLVLFIPTVFMNSAMWAQSDSIYTAFLVVGLLFLIFRKFAWSMLFYGIAFAFKLQAIFVLPVYIIVYFLNHRYRIYEFLIIPATYYVLSLPALIAGRSFIDVSTIYLRQTGTYQSMTLNMPNLYMWFPNRYDDFSTYAIVLFAILMAATLFRLMVRKIQIKPSVVVDLALWSVLMAVFFLPAMHERYLYIADILSLAYFMIRHKNGWVPIVTIGISTVSYFPFLFGFTAIDFKLVSIAYAVLLYHFTKLLFKELQRASDDAQEAPL